MMNLPSDARTHARFHFSANYQYIMFEVKQLQEHINFSQRERR
jgi:hypothetical protein